MKWLSGGLTFVNFATVCALLIGMLTGTCASILRRFFGLVLPWSAGGLGPIVAWIALILAAGLAFLAYLRTRDPESQSTAPDQEKSEISKYRKLPIWILAGFFVIFAV